MRFRKSRKEMINPQPQTEMKIKQNNKQSLNQPVIEVCVAIDCKTGDILDTDCDFSDNYNIACGNIPEKKCTPIKSDKTCKKLNTSVLFVKAERNNTFKR